MSETKQMEVQPKEQGEAKHNPYEPFRDVVRATVLATCVKVRDTSVTYTWALGKAMTACAEAAKLPIANTPEDFKRIVKFEFAKLRDEIATTPDYELLRSKQDFVLSNGQMKARLTNISLKIISLEKQLEEARKAYSRIGFKMTDENLSAEKRSLLRKKSNNYLVVIDHTTAEIERQKKLQAETLKAA